MNKNKVKNKKKSSASMRCLSFAALAPTSLVSIVINIATERNSLIR